MRNTYEELSCIYIWLQVGGPVWVMGIRVIGFGLEELMVIFLKGWGLQFIFLVRSTQQQGGEGEMQNLSLPVPDGGSIYNTIFLPSTAHLGFEKIPFPKKSWGKENKICEKQKQNNPWYASNRPRPSRAFGLLTCIWGLGEGVLTKKALRQKFTALVTLLTSKQHHSTATVSRVMR